MLSNVDVSKLKLPNGKTVGEQMIAEINQLKGILQREIDRWYGGYSPVRYSRTNNMRNSLYVDDCVQIEQNNLTISIKYSEDVFHKSLWDNTEINTLYILNYGYRVKKGWHKNISYFGYRSPANYLEEAVETFNKSSFLGFKASIQKPTSIYR